MEVAIIDLANLAENTSLSELQNRIARLEGGATNISGNSRSYSASPIQVSAYKTAPSPVTKPEMQKIERTAKSDNDKQIPKENAEQSGKITAESIEKFENKDEGTNIKEDNFSPVPMSKHSESCDIATLWGNLLNNVHSAPTRALLKQWANPVKIAPEETILTMKNEIFLNQVQSGSKKQSIVDAVNALFSQENSNVIIRLPHADDVQVKPVAVSPVEKLQPPPKPKPSPVMKNLEKEPEVSQKEVEELKDDVQNNESASASKIAESFHSDNVNMVMEIFEGKVID